MLVKELSDRGTQLEQLVIGLCRAIAIKNSSDEPRGSRRRRVLRHLLNHDGLLRLLSDVEPARNVYAQLEQHLDGDYHFWLQRGCLELECGDIRFAQNFLQQAVAINPSDALVETAMAHMCLRRAVTSPANPGAEELATGDSRRSGVSSKRGRPPTTTRPISSEVRRLPGAARLRCRRGRALPC